MEKMWAPWRMKYIQSLGSGQEGCIFCTKPHQESDRDNLIVHRGNLAFVILNAFPYNSGHLMVVPYRHTADATELRGETATELWDLVCLSTKVLSAAFRPDGFNIGMNVGRAAGAGIDQHVHMHIVPRWNGDTNFMSVLGETKVVSQDLWETYDCLRPYFEKMGAIS